MRDWKDTLNLPRTGFPMKANLPATEPATSGKDGVVRTPLITTTASGSTLEIMPGIGGDGGGLYYTDLNNAAKLRDRYRPGNTPEVLAWQISGRLPTPVLDTRRIADPVRLARRGEGVLRRR